MWDEKERCCRIFICFLFVRGHGSSRERELKGVRAALCGDRDSRRKDGKRKKGIKRIEL